MPPIAFMNNTFSAINTHLNLNETPQRHEILQRVTFDEALISSGLLKNHIDIWQFPLQSQSLSDAKTLLNPEELTRAERYHFSRHQRRFTVARAGLRLVLSHYTTLKPSALTFTYSTHSKPALLEHPDVHFNLSHSGELALLAVGREHPMGIDLERFSPRPYEGIGKQLFSTQENLALANTPYALKPLTFFHIWAQKEAFIKASGLGLSYPTQQFDVSPTAPTRLDIHDALHQKTWRMTSFMPGIACSAALCHAPEISTIRYISITDIKVFFALLYDNH